MSMPRVLKSVVFSKLEFAVSDYTANLVLVCAVVNVLSCSCDRKLQRLLLETFASYWLSLNLGTKHCNN